MFVIVISWSRFVIFILITINKRESLDTESKALLIISLMSLQHFPLSHVNFSETLELNHLDLRNLIYLHHLIPYHHFFVNTV